MNRWIVLEIHVQLLLRLERKRIENNGPVYRICDLLFQICRAHVTTREPEASSWYSTLLFIYYIVCGSIFLLRCRKSLLRFLFFYFTLSSFFYLYFLCFAFFFHFTCNLMCVFLCFIYMPS